MVELVGCQHVFQAVFRHFPTASFGDEFADVVSGNSVRLGRVNAEGLAVEIQIELSGGAISSANIVKSQLVSKVAMRLGLESVAEPILSANGDVELRGAQIQEGNVKRTAVESDDVVVVFCRFPKGGEHLRLIRKRHEGNGAVLGFLFFVIFGHKEHFSSPRFGIQHGDADDFRRKRPKREEPLNLFLLGLFRIGIRFACRRSEEIFQTGGVEAILRQGGSFNVEYERGHGLAFPKKN